MTPSIALTQPSSSTLNLHTAESYFKDPAAFMRTDPLDF